MPETISNTSPLQYLFQAGALHILPALFNRIYVPAAVAAELAEGKRRNVSLPAIEELSWVQVRSVRQPTLLPLVMRLGEGEKEVLALGLEQPASLLLLDDRDARRQAHTLGLKITGTLGVLLLAKEKGFLDTLRPILDRLQELQFRLDGTTRRSVLKLAKE